MTRRAFLTLPAVMGTSANVTAQSRIIDLAIGTFNATELESQEGYFSIGTGAMLALKQDGTPIMRARELVGTTGTLLWVQDDKHPAEGAR